MREFYDCATNTQFVPRGNNYVRLVEQRHPYTGQDCLYHGAFMVGHYDPAKIEQALEEMHLSGYNVIRVFLDTLSEVAGIGNPAGGISSIYMGNFVDFLHKVKEHNIFVLVTVDDLPMSGGYLEKMYIEYSTSFGGYNIHYLTQSGLEANILFWQDFINILREYPSACWGDESLGLGGFRYPRCPAACCGVIH